jgi:hypothetical protein
MSLNLTICLANTISSFFTNCRLLKSIIPIDSSNDEMICQLSKCIIVLCLVVLYTDFLAINTTTFSQNTRDSSIGIEQIRCSIPIHGKHFIKCKFVVVLSIHRQIRILNRSYCNVLSCCVDDFFRQISLRFKQSM